MYVHIDYKPVWLAAFVWRLRLSVLINSGYDVISLASFSASFCSQTQGQKGTSIWRTRSSVMWSRADFFLLPCLPPPITWLKRLPEERGWCVLSVHRVLSAWGGHSCAVRASSQLAPPSVEALGSWLHWGSVVLLQSVDSRAWTCMHQEVCLQISRRGKCYLFLMIKFLM